MKLVFVHLGKRKAWYLKANVNRLRMTFPDLKIVVIHDSLSRQMVQRIKGVEFYDYESAREDLEDAAEFNQNERFRQGFWRLTTERLFALIQYHKSNQSDSILHIESDVLLFPNFPFETFSTLNQISWCRFNESKDVASILFLPDLAESKWFERELIRQFKINPETTDMNTLSVISALHSEKVGMLPSLPDFEKNTLQNRNNQKINTHFVELSHQYERFGGIFDPAAIGMWLCGIDPENTHGALVLHDPSFLHNGDSFVDPSGAHFVVSDEGNLFFKNKLELVPVFNLHVHSKDKKIFSDEWVSEIRGYVNYSLETRVIVKHRIRNYIRVYLAHTQDRDLVRYVCSHPKIYPKVKKIQELGCKLSKKNPNSQE